MLNKMQGQLKLPLLFNPNMVAVAAGVCRASVSVAYPENVAVVHPAIRDGADDAIWVDPAIPDHDNAADAWQHRRRLSPSSSQGRKDSQWSELFLHSLMGWKGLRVQRLHQMTKP